MTASSFPPPIDTSVEPAIRGDNDRLVAHGDTIHGGVRFRKRPPDALPVRSAVIASEQSVASRGPKSCGMPQIHGKGIEVAQGNCLLRGVPSLRAVDACPDPALDHGVKGLR